MTTVWSTVGSREPLPTGWRALLATAAVALLLAAPWTGVAGGMDFAARALVLAVLVAGQELVTGRGGVLTFTHAPFAVLGGAGVAIASSRLGGGLLAIVGGLLATWLAVQAINAVLAFATWRAGRWVFALASLAVAIVLPWLGTQWAGLHAVAPIRVEAPGWSRMQTRLAYAALGVSMFVCWLLLLRFANSPFGRVLPALRDNPPLAETLGYRPALYRAISTAMAAGVAVPAGAALAWWQHAPVPIATGCLDIGLQVLLAGWIGGFGTMWAAPVGAIVVLAAWRGLPLLMLIGAGRVPDVPWLAALLSDPISQRGLMTIILVVAGWAVGGLMVRGPRR